MDYLAKLQEIERENEKAKLTKATLEERLKNLQKEKDEILAKLSEIGIDPKDLVTTISDLEKQIKEELEKCVLVLKN